MWQEPTFTKTLIMPMLRIFCLVLWLIPSVAYLQLPVLHTGFTHADSLRGSITPERIWWDAVHYNLSVKFDISNKTISGSNTITYKVLMPYSTMQIDLMEPLVIDSIVQNAGSLNFKKDGNAYFIELAEEQYIFEFNKIAIYYHGIPREAANPPWDGGVVWEQDAENNPWVTVACQGLGASVWYPNKDHQYDEPDSATMHFTVPEELTVVSNGRPLNITNNQNGFATHSWQVSYPINNYNIIPYIGKYSKKHLTYKGLKGDLDVDLYFLSYNLEKAISHVQPDLLKTFEAFEYWFGPYPFYNDGYKIVETPHLGMEHQTAIAYGNHFKKGYLGMDLSGTGVGTQWDYIVVHETGHEWFGNNITTKDIADMWVQEGFTCYSETLFTEYWFGRESANKYIQGLAKTISNDYPIIGQYNVNNEGSGDMYTKGAYLVHTVRSAINNDSLFRSILIGMNTQYSLKVVRTEQIENYFSEHSGIDFSRVFDQYLRTADIPQLEYKLENGSRQKTLSFRWTNCIDGFNLPIKVKIGEKWVMINPTTEWSVIPVEMIESIDDNRFIDPNFYVTGKRVI